MWGPSKGLLRFGGEMLVKLFSRSFFEQSKRKKTPESLGNQILDGEKERKKIRKKLKNGLQHVPLKIKLRLARTR